MTFLSSMSFFSPPRVDSSRDRSSSQMLNTPMAESSAVSVSAMISVPGRFLGSWWFRPAAAAAMESWTAAMVASVVIPNSRNSVL